MIEAVRGLGRVLGSYGKTALIRAVLRWGLTPRALLTATAARHPDREAWVDAQGSLTYTELVAEIHRRAAPPSTSSGTGAMGPGSVVRETDPRELVLQAMAALSAGRGVLVAGERAGTRAVTSPPRRGIVFLTSGTTGAPRVARTKGGILRLLPYLGMIGRLPALTAPRVGSVALPDHGHAFLLVVMAWALAGTYVQVSGRVDRLDVLSGVPIQLSDALNAGWLGSVRLVVAGSDRLPRDLAQRLGADLGAEVWDSYGSTEAGSISLASPADVAAGTVGCPLPGVSVRCVGDRLEVTTPSTLSPFTDDRGRIDAAGRIVLTGRADNRHVSGGEVVDPDLLQQWLAAVPGVKGVAVQVVPDARFGSRLTAEVVGELPDVELIRQRIRRDLGPAHVPTTIVVIDSGSGLEE